MPKTLWNGHSFSDRSNRLIESAVRAFLRKWRECLIDHIYERARGKAIAMSTSSRRRDQAKLAKKLLGGEVR
jgi:hypothetical protein